MKRSKADGYADLARKLNLGVGGDRKVQRWADGSHAPDYENTMLLLRAARLLRGKDEAGGEDGAGADPASSTPAVTQSERERLARVEERVDAILELNERSFVEIAARFERLEHRLDEQAARAVRRRRTG